MPFSEALAEIDRAEAAAERAAAVLVEKDSRPHDLHLPLEDVKIAQRFLALARTALREREGKGAEG